MLEILVYLFENYMDVDMSIYPDQDALEQELIGAGFSQQDIDQALDWLETLESRQQVAVDVIDTPCSMRHYAPQECAKLDVECRGFIVSLEQRYILNQASRELVIDQVMALSSVVTLEQLKWVILIVLFNQSEQQTNVACWIEELICDEDSIKQLH